MRCFCTRILLILSLFISFQKNFASIRELVESTYVPSNIYIGGGSTNFLSAHESNFSNAALLSTFRGKAGGGIGYSRIGLIDTLWAQVFIPSPVGSLSVNGGFLDNKRRLDLPELTSYYFLSVGYARQFTRKFSFGFYFKPALGFVQDDLFFSLAFEPSFLYNTKIQLPFGSGFGLHDLSFYFLAHNLGVNIINPASAGPRISLHLGTQFIFYKKYDFKAALNAEIIGVGDYQSLPARIGLHMQYRFVNIGVGYAVGTQNDLFNGFTFGGGFFFDLKEASFSLNYAYAFLDVAGTNNEALHTVFLRFNIGYTDKSPPEVHVKQNLVFFSPNWDGQKDYVNFDLVVKDKSLIKSWKFLILDSNKNVVRKFDSGVRDFEKTFGFKDFFLYLFQNQKYVSAPSRIRWDGTADIIALEHTAVVDKKGKLMRPNQELPEGDYFYSFDVRDEWGNQSQPFQGFIKIDRTPPDIQVSSTSPIFSPNGDHVLDELMIRQKSKSKNNDHWKAGFYNSENKIVKTYEWQGKSIPSRLIWDGKDDQNNLVPEGLYTYAIEGSDPAGNKTQKHTQEISLVRKIDHIDIKLSSSGLSPNEDGIMDILSVKPIIFDQKGILDWKIIISETVDDKGMINNAGTVNTWSGTQKVPQSIKWNGQTSRKNILEDGTYYIQFFVRYRSGNQPSSLTKKIVVDTKPPELSVDASPSVFSPDGDGEDEEIDFELSMEDDSEIAEYSLDIYEVSSDSKGNENTIRFKRFKGGSQYSKKIIWNGQSDKGNSVESASEYRYQLIATDKYGNQAQSDKGKFETDILVLVTERGLKIRISNVEFDLGKAALKPSTKDLIEKVYDLLQKYNSYQVKVEGHTDDLGEESYNLRLSEQRAKSVVDYLLTLGINENRLSYQGVGEISPILPNKNWYNRSRNRRVEFLLQKNNDR